MSIKTEGSAFIFINNELVYENLKRQGELIEIDGEKSVELKKNEIVSSKTGIFGVEIGEAINTDIKIEEYSCDCGELTSRVYDGVICPMCETKVKQKPSAQIDVLAFINLGKHKVITGEAYKMVYKVIGSALDKIVAYDAKLDLDGNINNKFSMDTKKFENIGLYAFYENFEKIMNFYINKHKKNEKKVALAKYLIKKKKRIFTSKIPVISTVLRSTYISSKTKSISFTAINKNYQNLSNLATTIKNLGPENPSILSFLCEIQKEIIALSETVISTKLNGKNKIIRSCIVGSNMNYSARNIIIPSEQEWYDIDCMQMNYITFISLYEPLMINCMINGIGTREFMHLSPYEIREEIKMSKYLPIPPKSLYNLAEFIVQNRKPGHELVVLVNRAPTMDLGSIQALKINHIIKNDITGESEPVIAIPMTSLPEWNGDFDGDVLSQFALQEKEIVDVLNRAFNPRRLVASKTSSNFYNTKFNVHPESGVALHTFMRNNE